MHLKQQERELKLSNSSKNYFDYVKTPKEENISNVVKRSQCFSVDRLARVLNKQSKFVKKSH